jgi:ABC-type oligopeptide transport system ATPase subunit
MSESTEPKKYYTQSVKKAIYKYRENNRDNYNERQRNYYAEKTSNEEWKAKFNERCKIANQKYRKLKAEQNPPKPRGRPRKVLPPLVERTDNEIFSAVSV